MPTNSQYHKTSSSGEADSPHFLKIGELSSLFHIGEDSIRYYEKVGLLHPIRDPENHYRYYTLDDVRTMNTIRELLGLGFSTKEILNFETDRNLHHVTDMLKAEQDTIDQQIAELQAKRKNISARLQSIAEDLNLDCSGNISVLKLPERPILMITESDMPDQMVNYELALFLSGQRANDSTTATKNSSHMSTIGACDCYILDTATIRKESHEYRTKKVFFYAPYLQFKCNDTLPEGLYLSACYRGALSGTTELVPKMLTYAAEQAYEVIGDPIEFCHIDRYETSVTDEYLTEVQIPVRIIHE